MNALFIQNYCNPFNRSVKKIHPVNMKNTFVELRLVHDYTFHYLARTIFLPGIYLSEQSSLQCPGVEFLTGIFRSSDSAGSRRSGFHVVVFFHHFSKGDNIGDFMLASLDKEMLPQIKTL